MVVIIRSQLFTGRLHFGGALHGPVAAGQLLGAVGFRRRHRGNGIRHIVGAVYFHFAQCKNGGIAFFAQQPYIGSGGGGEGAGFFAALAGVGAVNRKPLFRVVRNLDVIRSGEAFFVPIQHHLVDGADTAQIDIHPFVGAALAAPQTGKALFLAAAHQCFAVFAQQVKFRQLNAGGGVAVGADIAVVFGDVQPIILIRRGRSNGIGLACITRGELLVGLFIQIHKGFAVVGALYHPAFGITIFGIIG